MLWGPGDMVRSPPTSLCPPYRCMISLYPRVSPSKVTHASSWWHNTAHTLLDPIVILSLVKTKTNFRQNKMCPLVVPRQTIMGQHQILALFVHKQRLPKHPRGSPTQGWRSWHLYTSHQEMGSSGLEGTQTRIRIAQLFSSGLPLPNLRNSRIQPISVPSYLNYRMEMNNHHPHSHSSRGRPS